MTDTKIPDPSQLADPPEVLDGDEADQLATPQTPLHMIPPLEMTVEHKVMIVQKHFLVGVCPACKDEVRTDNAREIEMFEHGAVSKCTCQCGQPLSVPGRSRLLTPTDAGRVTPVGRLVGRLARKIRGR